MKRTKPGSEITVSVEVLDETGELIETSDPEAPMEILLGDGEFPPTVEEAMIDQVEGAVIEVTCPEGEAFGDPDPEAIVAVPTEDFPEDLELKKGVLVGITIQGDDEELEEEEMAATVIEVNEDGVILDANHPLAGKPATFRVTIHSIA